MSTVTETYLGPSRVDLKIEGVALSDISTDFEHGWENQLKKLNDVTRMVVTRLADKNCVLRIRIQSNHLHVFVDCGSRLISLLIRDLLGAELRNYVPPPPRRLRDFIHHH